MEPWPQAVEALADVWASLDGEAEKFRAGKVGDDADGHYEGYLSDAKEMIKRLFKRGFIVVPSGE